MSKSADSPAAGQTSKKTNDPPAPGGETPLVPNRMIPHPWKAGEQRAVYEFPITRKIVIEADADLSVSDVIDVAQRCNDKELFLELSGSRYRMHLSPIIQS